MCSMFDIRLVLHSVLCLWLELGLLQRIVRVPIMVKSCGYV